MTEIEEILKRLEKVESELESLKSAKSPADLANDFERLPNMATVGKEYVAYRFGCSEEAVRRGRAGTSALRLKCKSASPMKWIKRDVDQAWKDFSRTPRDKALEDIAKAENRKRRRKSIIKKSL